MGVIQRQSLKYSLVNFAGLLIGVLSIFYVYPLSLGTYGLINYFLQLGIIGLPLLSLGANLVSIRFFPRFEDKSQGNHGFLGILLWMSLLGFAVCSLLLLLLRPWILEFLRDKDPLLLEHIWLAAPFTFLYILNLLLAAYAANFKRIVVPSLLLDFSQKLILPLLVFAVWKGWISQTQAIYGLLGHSVLVFFGLLAYFRHLGQLQLRPDWSYITPAMRSEMIRYAAFGALGGFGFLLATKFDMLFVSSFITLSTGGVYAIASNLSAVFEIPTKGLYSASVSSVSKYITEGRHEELRDLYQKGSVALLIGGLLLLGGMWVSVHEIYALSPKAADISEGKYVLLLLGLAKLADMSTGFNNYIVYYSKYYAYSLISQLSLAVLNVVCMVWLTADYGMNGTAAAILISVSVYNLMNAGFVWAKFRMLPFTQNTLKAIGIALVAYTVAAIIPKTGINLMDIALRSGTYALLFGAAVLYWKIAPEYNHLLGGLWKKIRPAS